MDVGIAVVRMMDCWNGDLLGCWDIFLSLGATRIFSLNFLTPPSSPPPPPKVRKANLVMRFHRVTRSDHMLS